MFRNRTKINAYHESDYFLIYKLGDVSRLSTFRMMFYNTPSFDADMSGWDLSSAITLEYMFHLAYSFNGDMSGKAPFFFSMTSNVILSCRLSIPCCFA